MLLCQYIIRSKFLEDLTPTVKTMVQATMYNEKELCKEFLAEFNEEYKSISSKNGVNSNLNKEGDPNIIYCKYCGSERVLYSTLNQDPLHLYCGCKYEKIELGRKVVFNSFKENRCISSNAKIAWVLWESNTEI